ncbi:rhamnulokinase [candidate division KSB1 bacterium]|nr:rhamnulokinase [candidate division KSB1 bacterium]RQW11060.1 MAG: rhamnulokinase [candidate division KSB1 bacterium]
MALEKYLAFDLGASSGRALVGIYEKDGLRLEETHRFPNRMVHINGHFHWDILQLFDEIKIGLARTAHLGHKDIRSIGVDTWGVDFGLLGRRGVLLGNPYAYRDMDTDEVMQIAFERIPREQLYKKTGIQFMSFNSIFQLLRLVQEQSPLLEVAEKLLFIPDLLNHFLTGEMVSEYTIASTSQLLNPWSKTWEKEIFDRLNLPLRIIPDIVPPGTRLGQLRREIAEEAGLPRVPVVAPACHDTASAVAAVPATGENWAYLSSGTWSLIGVASPQPIINDIALANNFTNEGGVDDTIRFLKNVAGLWLVQRCKSDWAKEGEELSYNELTRLAEEAGPSSCHVDPDDPAFTNPLNMPAAMEKYCRDSGQPVPMSKGQYIRCALESLARKYKQVLDNLNTMLPQPLQRLHIVGGGAQNLLLNRLTKEMTGLEVIAGPVEATGMGNVILQRRAR